MITNNFDSFVDGGTQKNFTIAVVGESVTIGNENMLQDSITLDEALCSENDLRFGACESSQLTVQVANVFDNFENKQIAVSVEMDGATTKYGTFRVKSDKPTADRIWRVLTAYDAMHDIINANVAEWYNGLTFPMTLQAFRNSFFTHLGITQKSVTLINDNFNLVGGFSAGESLSGKVIINAICELNGVFGHINRDNQFEYISLDSASNFSCPPYENNSVTYEDYVTSAITKITMRGSASDVGTSVGVDGNEYIITNNPLIYGTEGTTALTNALTALLTKVSTITFRPYTLGKTIGNPCVEIGDAITIESKYQTITSYVIRRTLTGIQALRDAYSASGNKTYPQEVNSLKNEITRTQGRMNELVRTVDETRSTITRIEDLAETASEDASEAKTTADETASDLANNYYTKSETTSQINQSASSILTQVSETYTQKANAISTDTLHYLATSQSSGVTTETAGWTTTIQTMTETNKYLWTYHTYTYANGTTRDTTPVITGVYGNDGATGPAGPQGASGEDAKVYSVDSGNQWVKSGTVISGANVWQSDSNYNVNSGQARCLITFSGFTTFTIMARSNGENNYDYLEIGKLDATSITRNGDNYYTFKGKASTTYTAVTFNDLDGGTHTVWLLYSKDSSSHSNEDRGFFYIPDAVGASEGIGISNVTPLYYVSNSTTAPAKPTSAVTSTSTSTGVWTKALPSLSTSYPYLYTCDQVKYTDGSYGWSDVVLDNAISTSYSEIKQTKDQIVLKVDNNGNIVKVALGSDASAGSTFAVNADSISFVANTTIDLKTGKIGIESDNFTIDKTTGNVTITGDVVATTFTADEAIKLRSLYATSGEYITKTLFQANWYQSNMGWNLYGYNSSNYIRSSAGALTGFEFHGSVLHYDSVIIDASLNAKNIGFWQTATDITANTVAIINSNKLIKSSSVSASKLELLNGFDYSTTEQNTHRTWIDGKTIYQRTIDFGYLPNNSSLSASYGVNNIDKIINISAYADNGTIILPIPTPSDSNIPILLWVDKEYKRITIKTLSNRSAMYCYVTIWYTKK